MDDERRKRLEDTTRYEPSEVEGRILERWLDGGYFHPDAEGSPDENFSIAIPPPNVTGALHMGHALNGTVQDVLTRLNRMRGRNSLWALGLDHAGIATQAVVERELREEGKSRQEIGREAFVKRVWEWRERYGSQIVEQYKRLGASCDYERERFTLDEAYVRAVYRVFVALYDKGLIYRDNYIVNWDPGTRSAISDLEVVNREVDGHALLHRLSRSRAPIEVLTVATVRPETMLADTAVAVNPEDERYRDLVGGHCILPLVGRRLPVIADEHVDPEFGTGALKITPGHDPNDFEIGRAHGLEEIVVIGEDGRMNEAAGERFAGPERPRRADAVVEALRAEGRIRAEEPYAHSVAVLRALGRADRAADQPSVVHADGRAGHARRSRWSSATRSGSSPTNYKRVYLDWMRNIRPWCVSRQLWWGHRHPGVVLRRLRGDYVAESPPERVRRRAAASCARSRTCSTRGSAPRCGRSRPSDGPTRRPSSQAFYPTELPDHGARDHLPLGRADGDDGDRVRRATSRSDDVYVHPVIQAPDGRRMSKSLGTGIDPLDEIDVHGADGCGSACSRCPRPRTSATAPSASSRAGTWRTRCGTPRGLCC